MEPSRASVFGFLRRRGLVLALCSPSFVCLLWFLYWIGYDLVVWSKPLASVNPFNYAGAALSLTVILAGLRLRAMKIVTTPINGQNEKPKTVLEQGGKEEQPPLLRGLEQEESHLIQEKRDLLALKERLELETREKTEATKRNVETLKSEVADLKRQVEELTRRLKTME